MRGWMRHLVTGLLAAAIMYPILWLAASSLKAAPNIFASLSLWPDPVRWANYLSGWMAVQGYSFGHFLLNSILVSGLTVLGTVLSTSLAAYGFARFRFPFKGLWFVMMLASIMIPAEMIVIPQYLVFAKLGWINTYLPLIVPGWLATMNGGFFIFLIMQFIRGIPHDLDDAARIDGCGRFRFFVYILFPMLQPVLVTVGIFAFLWSWENFLSPLLYLNTVSRYTVPLALNLFRDSSNATSWGPLFAMSFVSLVPLFILFFIAQRYIIQGIQTSGLTG